MTMLGLPFLLEDKTGSIQGSDFVDLYERLHVRIARTAHTPQHTAYVVHRFPSPSAPSVHSSILQPDVVLDFGPRNTLGTVSVGRRTHVPMGEYLVRVSGLGSSRARKFLASDGLEYRWTWRAPESHEWTCLNARGYLIAHYDLKLEGEPAYSSSSGCMLTINEAYPHLASELLASLVIMRHIAMHNL